MPDTPTEAPSGWTSLDVQPEKNETAKVVAPEVPPEPDEAQEPEDDHGVGREAARYRRQLRETETERDGLRDQLAEVRRQIAEDHSGLAKPGALWAAGVSVDDLFTAEGRLDPERLTQSVGEASERLGLTRAPRSPRPDPNQGRDDGAPAPNGRAAWDAALKS